ncbi:MAG: hypothetical protein IJ530_01115 [Treponema sp.]|uniref:hypothetical protein n=1 Tax=Treponema sp. TaxID=166 RepID=UPI0025CCD8A7|nr:hypothetical protein [Treponema sp.]MBQ8678345.1 hypothetical protein [Treponema sp.]
MTKADLKSRLPNVHFIKTKHPVERPNIALLREAFIPDDDMPVFPENITDDTRIYPLSVTAYPSVLRRMTAMEAGVWAIEKCHEQNWALELDNFQCCLANLEMDF